MRVYQQVIDMGEGGVETLEKTIGCTLSHAFALLSGRRVVSTGAAEREPPGARALARRLRRESAS
jgi:hypothetical protein